MITKYPDGSVSYAACIRAIDLIKIADQMFKDNMQYANIRIIVPYDSSLPEIVRLSAIPDAMSEDCKIYPEIKANTILDFDEEDYM